MRKLADTTMKALRAFPNAPGVKYEVYARVWDPVLNTWTADINLTWRVVQDSLGSIDWTLERAYSQLTPGDIQFKIRDIWDELELLVSGSIYPVQLDVWGAPVQYGAGDWAMLFHGYIEPDGVTRAPKESALGIEPNLIIKDVYAKSYLSARLDAVRAEPLCFWTGVQPLEYVVRRLGDYLISGAGHDVIDYDIQIAYIPTKDGRLVLSAWEQPEYAFLNGPSWIVREDDGYWYILMWYGLTQSLRYYQLDKRTYRVSNMAQVLTSPDYADHGRFHYVDANHVLLTLSRHEDFTVALPVGTFQPLVLKEAILISRSDPTQFSRWRADAHTISSGGYEYKPTGYCAVADNAGDKHLVLWCDRFWDNVGGIPAWDDVCLVATLSMADLVADNDCAWNSGVLGFPGYICGGATCSTDNSGQVYASATLADLVNPGRKTYLIIVRGSGAGFTVFHHNLQLGTVPFGLMQDANHESSRVAAAHVLYENENAAQSWYVFGNVGFALTQTPPTWLQEYRHENNDWTEVIGLVDHTGHHHVVHYWTQMRTGLLAAEFYGPADSLQLANGGGYFTKLNWTTFAQRLADPGATGYFWAWRAYVSAPLVLIAGAFQPLFDLDNAKPSADETVRSFIGRICEATGHMILFPGRATPHGPIIWRVRPRQLQPPDYCLTARDVLADGIEIQGPRKLRLIVTTQGTTYAYPDTETAALLRLSELGINNDGIPPSVADDFAYWLWQIFDTQNQVVKCDLDAVLHVEVGDSVDLTLGAADYFQGVVTRQSLSSVTGRGQVELLCQAVTPGNRLTPKREQST